jgi:hypothetical protein
MFTHYGDIMLIPRFLPAADFEKLKQATRHLKRDSDITHHEALEQTALANRFQNWHQVAQLAKETQPNELAFRSGFVLAFDAKEAHDNHRLPDDLFHADGCVGLFCEADLLKYYKDDSEEDIDSPADDESKAEFDSEYFDDFMNNLYFIRFAGSVLPDTIQQAMKLVSDRSVFAPPFVWFRGKYINVFKDLSVDGTLKL